MACGSLCAWVGLLALLASAFSLRSKPWETFLDPHIGIFAFMGHFLHKQWVIICISLTALDKYNQVRFIIVFIHCYSFLNFDFKGIKAFSRAPKSIVGRRHGVFQGWWSAFLTHWLMMVVVLCWVSSCILKILDSLDYYLKRKEVTCCSLLNTVCLCSFPSYYFV
jgi:hypothetical protein